MKEASSQVYTNNSLVSEYQSVHTQPESVPVIRILGCVVFSATNSPSRSSTPLAATPTYQASLDVVFFNSVCCQQSVFLR